MIRVWSFDEAAAPLTATISRHLPINVADISAAGCFIESAEPIAEGTVGTLVLDLEGRRYVETIRVCRVEPVRSQGHRFRAGAQFLTLGASRRSLRHLAATTRTVVAPETNESAPAGTASVTTLAEGPDAPATSVVSMESRRAARRTGE
jgi:hypothetical protein